MDDLDTRAILALSDDEGEDPKQAALDIIKREYFAAKPYFSADFAQDVCDIFDDHLQYAHHSGLGDVIWRAYCIYHLLDNELGGGVFGAPTVRPMMAGDQGEFILTDVAHYRNLIKHKKTLITGERPSFQPQAATSDGSAMMQVNIARHVIDYVLDQRYLGRGLHQTVEAALVMGSAFLHLGWNPYAGNPTGQRNKATGKPVYTGDLEWHSLTPFEVAHQRVRGYGQAAWHIVRTFVSRYDTAAKLIDKGQSKTAQKLLQQEYSHADYHYTMPWANLHQSDETIPVYTFYHDRTPAVPSGRMAVVTGEGLVLWDGPLPFPRAPIYRMAPNEFLGTAIPFADSWSWLALHEVANAMLSPIISRVDAFGNPIVSVPEGGDWSVDSFGGFRMHERTPGTDPPSLIDFSNIPPSLSAAYQMVVGEMDRISGINSVVRGQPAENISSGSMAALVHAQAVQFNSDDEEQFVSLGEQAIMGAIQLYQSMASEEMLITISGKDGEPSLVTFKRDSINTIKRVTAKRTNALMKTTEWKQEAANVLLANGLIKSPQEYLAMVETGTYETIFTDDTRLMATIREENAMLLRGEKPRVSQVEPFHLHVLEHASLISPGVTPEIEKVIVEHLGETMAQWQKQSMEAPSMLEARGVPVLPPPPQVQQAMAAAGMQPPGQGGEEQGPKKPGPKAAPQTPGVDNKSKAAGPPNQPNMPKQPDGSPVEM